MPEARRSEEKDGPSDYANDNGNQLEVTTTSNAKGGSPRGDMSKIEKCGNSSAKPRHSGNSSSIKGLARCNERRRAP